MSEVHPDQSPGSEGSPGAPSGFAALAAWIATLALAYLWVGPMIGARMEGVLASAPQVLLPVGATAMALLSAFLLTRRWALARSRRSSPTADGTELDRRRFLIRVAGTTAGGAVGAAAAVAGSNLGWLVRTGSALGARTPLDSPTQSPQWKDARIRSYRRLGRTNVEVSDISLGSAAIRPESGGEELARAALDRGVNYFDTAPDYSASGSETALGRAMRGRRDQVFLATKFCTPRGHLPAGSKVAEYMAVVEASLKRLQTDHVDLVHIHSCNSVDRLLDENVHEAFDRLREQGKARFLGVSTHTPRLEEVATAALDSERFDVMMLAYHYGAWPRLTQIIDRAAALDIGIVAMKTLKGARHEGLLELAQAERRSYPQAAFRWVLSNPKVSSLVISFRKPEHVDEYLAASGQTPLAGDTALLEKYDRAIAGKHCFQHCGECLSACPEQLQIHDVLRHRMYFEDYGEQKEAMRLYSELSPRGDVCTSCSAPCNGACPFGVPIRESVLGAHRLLS